MVLGLGFMYVANMNRLSKNFRKKKVLLVIGGVVKVSDQSRFLWINR